MIDPGHGGSDLGATSNGFFEKDFTLSLAKEVKRQLEIKKYPVTLTRMKDEEISLQSRSQLANKENAKLFLSIHLNSSPPLLPKQKKGPEGVETFILNNTSNATSKRLQDLENKGIKLTEGSEKTNNGDVNLILKDMTLDGNQAESKRLACHLQSELVHVTKQKHRGIKQALFVVLLGAEMPSALIEVGFMNSEKDRKLLQNEHGLRAMAASIIRAIDAFRTQKKPDHCLIHEQS